MELEWVEESEVPRIPARRGKWEQVVAELDRNPGRWAIVYRQGDESNEAARQRKYSVLRTAKNREDYEVATRNNGGGKVVVYARRKPELNIRDL